MPLRKLLLMPLLLGVAAVSSLKPAQAQEVDAVEWLDNYQEALLAAKATGKPIFLEYRCEP
jgi:hypothetical protein